MNPKSVLLYFILGVALAGAVAAAEPLQATQARAFFNEGQTFLTWTEAGPEAQYRIYRSITPFVSSDQLTDAALVATVHAHSSLNLMASVNRMDLSRVPAAEAYRIPAKKFFIIKAGDVPLTDETGLYVHTAKNKETAFYAVTAVHAGAEFRTVGSNCLSAGVAEKVEAVGAVPQNDEIDYVHWTAVDGAFNFRVHGPRSGRPVALIGVLHGALFQYNTPDKDRYAKLDGEEGDRAVRVAMDSPLVRGRIEGLDLKDFGYGNEAPGARGGMPRGWGDAAARVLWTMEWVAAHYPVDKDRFSLRGESMGGIGSITVAMANPGRFAAFNAYVPVFGSEGSGGPASWAMMRFNAYEAVRKNPQQDFPYIMFTAGRADHIVGWDDKLEFARFAEAQRLGFIFYWDAREHAYQNVAKYTPVWGEPGGRPTADLSRFSIRQSYPAISALSVKDDLGTKNPLAVRPADRGPLNAPGMGDLVGTINGQVDWDRDSIVDRAGRYEITLRLLSFSSQETATADVTPRRLQGFKPGAGTACHYRVEADGRTLAEGKAVVDSNGSITIAGVPLTRSGVRLVIEAAP
jgi:hypothetical protein